MTKHNFAGEYYADGMCVLKAPKRTKNPKGGTSVTIGFPVCAVAEIVGSEGVDHIVAALNMYESGHAGCFCPHCNPQDESEQGLDVGSYAK